MQRIDRCVALALKVVLGVALAASSTTPWAAYAPAYAAHGRVVCGSGDGGFKPQALSIDDVVASTRILARGEDRNGVPKAPPLTDRGKWQLAWDKKTGIRPGDPAGVVRLTAHTYPRDAGRGALGNRLLARLRVGAQITVTGSGGASMCYQVERLQRVRARDGAPAFYDMTGPPRLAILVCSGKRTGPGQWSHRTIWYAAPVDPDLR